eukprot:3303595-Pyramimonas_sp.AAC.1
MGWWGFAKREQFCESSPPLHTNPDRTDLDLKRELPEYIVHIVADPEETDRGTCQEDAPRN